MFGRSMFRGLEEDPFFAAHRNHMANMSQMFNDPFQMQNIGPRMVQAGRDPRVPDRSRAVQQQQQQQQQMDPFGFGMFDNMMFGNMRNMMANMHQQFDNVGNNPAAGGHSFVQSSFMSYSNTGDGAPKVYQASSSTRRAPGGIKETKKMEKDSASGLEKMAIGHHIQDRGHVIERSRNRRTGDENENQEFHHLDDTEAQEFDREWTEKTQQFRGPTRLEYARRGERSDRRRDNLAIEGSKKRDKHSYRERD
ncbi:myeloid leukemia factor 1 [Mytilus galloprovincialis]|uniref:Myeloid leukemia factor 1 n=1 Tax=Mytilus galloprovincialis TaxID=29158 RepID=A0A8B6BGN5_MYTGA|nr:myeloid leukemia factor 1 [Mytilus galloprovincialis]